jgi:acetyltransferase-like isoleucine patch superfamily enzyme
MKRPEESGFIMALALVLLVLGSVVIVPCITTASSALKINQECETNSLGRYTAEAGIADVTWRFQQGKITPTNASSYFPYNLPGTVNGSLVTVKLLRQQDLPGDMHYFIVQANGQSSITGPSKILVTIQQSGTMANNVFDKAVVGLGGNVSIGGISVISSDNNTWSMGDVFANGNVILTSLAKVYGNAGATGTVSTSGLASVGGTKTNNASQQDPLNIDYAQYILEAQAGGTSSTILFSGNNPQNLGPKYINGNLTIQDNVVVTLQGTVYVTGTITISGNAKIQGPYTIFSEGNMNLSGNSSTQLARGTVPFLVSRSGTITIGGNSWISAIVYAPSGSITLNDNACVFGSVVGKSVTTTGNNQVKLLTGIRTLTQFPDDGLGATTALLAYDYE